MHYSAVTQCMSQVFVDGRKDADYILLCEMDIEESSIIVPHTWEKLEVAEGQVIYHQHVYTIYVDLDINSLSADKGGEGKWPEAKEKKKLHGHTWIKKMGRIWIIPIHT